MEVPSNPAPLYPAIGWVGNLLPLSFLLAFNLCVLPRAPPGLRTWRTYAKSLLDPPRKASRPGRNSESQN